MRDEGIGVHAVRELRKNWTDARAELIEAGTALVDALDLAPAGADAIVVDAASGGGPPGSVYRFGLEDVAAERGVSLHESSLPEAFAVAQVAGARFGRVVILGIEPGAVEAGTGLSPALEAKLPAILALIRSEVARMLGASF
jgi:hydrogenase maturation protease